MKGLFDKKTLLIIASFIIVSSIIMFPVFRLSSPDRDSRDFTDNTSIAEEDSSADYISYSNGEGQIVSYNSVIYSTYPGEESTLIRVGKYYDILPAGMRKKFEESGYSVQVVPGEIVKKISGIQSPGYPAGVTRTKYKVILISDNIDFEGAIIHEMGHWVDCYNGINSYSKSLEFQRIYAKEGQNYTDYGASSVTEFFAEVFYGILMNDPNVNNCPQAVEYVTTVIQSYE